AYWIPVRILHYWLVHRHRVRLDRGDLKNLAPHRYREQQAHGSPQQHNKEIDSVRHRQQEAITQERCSDDPESGTDSIGGGLRREKPRENVLMWSKVVLGFAPEALNQLIQLVAGGGFEPPTFGL